MLKGGFSIMENDFLDKGIHKETFRCADTKHPKVDRPNKGGGTIPIRSWQQMNRVVMSKPIYSPP